MFDSFVPTIRMDRGNLYQEVSMRLHIRNVTPADLDAVLELERACFSEETAATRDAFVYRISAFPERFFVAEEDGRIVGLINGCASMLPRITDDLFEPQGHDPAGSNQMIFGLAVHPEYRRRGIGSDLMQTMIAFAQQTNMERLILTCLAEKVGYYEKFGYVNHGISQSVHGGEVWYDMILTLDEMNA